VICCLLITPLVEIFFFVLFITIIIHEGTKVATGVDWTHYPLTLEKSWPQIQYHNEGVYRNIEFFIKATLAMCTGIGVLYLGNQPVGLRSNLMIGLGLFEAVTGIYTMAAITQHLMSAMKRWRVLPMGIQIKDWYKWWDIHMMIFVLIISSVIWIVSYHWAKSLENYHILCII
jgi:hypothetical protein